MINFFKTFAVGLSVCFLLQAPSVHARSTNFEDNSEWATVKLALESLMFVKKDGTRIQVFSDLDVNEPVDFKKELDDHVAPLFLATGIGPLSGYKASLQEVLDVANDPESTQNDVDEAFKNEPFLIPVSNFVKTIQSSTFKSKIGSRQRELEEYIVALMKGISSLSEVVDRVIK